MKEVESLAVKLMEKPYVDDTTELFRPSVHFNDCEWLFFPSSTA